MKSYDRSDWKNVRLGDIVEYSKGTGLSKEKLSDKGLYRCILYGELFTRYKEIINTVHSKTFCLEGTPSVAGDVLLPGSTTTCGEDLAKASSLNFEDILLGGDIIILRPKKNQVIGDFLSYLIPMYKKDMLKYTQGITIIHLQGKKLLDLTISIPPIDIQKNIVKNIQKIDLLISNLEKLISKQESIKKSTKKMLLTPKPGWKKFLLGDICDVSGAGVDKKIHPNEERVILLNYLDVYHKTYVHKSGLDHVVSAKAKQKNRCSVRKNDIFFTPSSETPDDIAKSCVAMEDMQDVAYSYHIIRARPKIPCNSLFVKYACSTHDFFAQAETQSRTNAASRKARPLVHLFILFPLTSRRLPAA